MEDRVEDPDFEKDPFFADVEWCFPREFPGSVLRVRHQGKTDYFLNNKVGLEGSTQEFLDCLHHYLPSHDMLARNLKEPLEVPKKGWANNYRNAFEYVRKYGIYTAERYPFEGFAHQKKDIPVINHDFKIFIKGFVDIHSVDRELILAELRKQPLTGRILMAKSFMKWPKDGGIYQGLTQEEKNWFEKQKAKKAEEEAKSWVEKQKAKKAEEDGGKKLVSGSHALTVVGYGSEGGVDYYLCQNSFGQDWGNLGYCKIRRDLVSHFNYPVGTYKSDQKKKRKSPDPQPSDSEQPLGQHPFIVYERRRRKRHA